MLNVPVHIKNIFLIGMMGTGKSTLGVKLAEKLEWSFVDLDAQIEKRAGTSISEIFSKQGEEAFRDMESEILVEVCRNNHQVIATGGGIILRDKNRMLMKKQGYQIWLKATPETIFTRVKDNPSRPVLGAVPTLEKIRSVLSQRETYYSKAPINMNTDAHSPEILTDWIIQLLVKSHQ